MDHARVEATGERKVGLVWMVVVEVVERGVIDPDDDDCRGWPLGPPDRKMGIECPEFDRPQRVQRRKPEHQPDDEQPAEHERAAVGAG